MSGELRDGIKTYAKTNLLIAGYRLYEERCMAIYGLG